MVDMVGNIHFFEDSDGATRDPPALQRVGRQRTIAEHRRDRPSEPSTRCIMTLPVGLLFTAENAP
eukprot:650799-Pyramimonas_sp.AAC.1